MKVLLTYPPVDRVHPWEGQAFVDRVTHLFEASPDKRGHRLVSSPEEADVILYLEPNGWKDRSYAELLLKERFIREFPEKCFAYNYAPFFIGFLPGIYANLDGRHPDQKRYGSWCYLWGLPNPKVEEMEGERDHVEPQWLFSFRGVNTAKVREVIFRHKEVWKEDAVLTEVDQAFFYKLTERQQVDYVEEILASWFVLCPRGLGCNSHRLFETMALGRVPVILSDAWVEPKGPDWRSFSLRIPERDAERLPEILHSVQDKAAEMGKRARRAWETWFADSVRIPVFFDRLYDLKESQSPVTFGDYENWWRSWRFYRQYGLAPHQKLLKNIRSGELISKIMKRLLR